MWLEHVLAAADGEALRERHRFGRPGRGSRALTWAVVRALAVHGAGDSPLLVRARERIVEEVVSSRSAAERSAETAALALSALCADPARARALPVQRAVEIASARLAPAESDPCCLRARIACASVFGAAREVDALRSAIHGLERDLEACALEPVVSTSETAERLHAWHACARILELDVRRHPVVHQSTLLLVQRTEAAAGEVSDRIARESRRLGAQADTLALARVALALFGVDDPILGPRAAFAAELAADAACARVRGGAARRSAAWLAPASILATALVLEALCAANEHAERPWTLPATAPVIPLNPPDARSPRLA